MTLKIPLNEPAKEPMRPAPRLIVTIAPSLLSVRVPELMLVEPSPLYRVTVALDFKTNVEEPDTDDVVMPEIPLTVAEKLCTARL